MSRKQQDFYIALTSPLISTLTDQAITTEDGIYNELDMNAHRQFDYLPFHMNMGFNYSTLLSLGAKLWYEMARY